MANTYLFFLNEINDWFKNSGRNFGWRVKKLTPYEILVLEFLLQKTKSQVIEKFYPKFIKKYPTVQKLARAKAMEVEKLLKPLGLSKVRAHRMIGTSKVIVDLHDSKTPSDFKELKDLPGVGSYIASAVICFGYGKYQMPIDVNVKRVIGRFFDGHIMGKIREGTSKNHAKKILQIAETGKNDPKKLCWAIIDFGGVVCTSRNPKCLICPLSKRCSFFQNA